MENLGDDLTFTEGDIDPNQLGFTSVTDPSYSCPSTSSNHMLRHIDGRENAVAPPALEIPYSAGTVNLQEYAATHMPALDSEGLHTFFHRTDDSQIEMHSDLLNDGSKNYINIQPAYNASTSAATDARQPQYHDGLAMQPAHSYSQPCVATTLPSLAGLLPFPNKVSSNSYVDANTYQNTTFRSTSYLPDTSASPLPLEPPAKSVQSNDFLETNSFSNNQRLNNSIISRTLSSILLPGLSQNPELFNQLSLQLQTHGLSTSQVGSIFSSLGPVKNFPESSGEIAAGPSALPATPGALPNIYGERSASTQSQEQVEQAPSTSHEDRSRNEPEMMIYHDKMTRKNILVPIGPPNVSAGRNMAPSPMFLEDTPRHAIQSPQVTEASSSDQLRPNNVNVSEFLNLPPRAIPREATPAPCQNQQLSQPDSPADNYVSSTTREDLPPLREILPRHNDVALLESSHHERDRFHLLASSFQAAAASSSDVIGFDPHEEGAEASGMLSLPEYEPISDSEDGEISTTCVMTPRQSYPQVEEEEEEDEEDEEEGTEEEEEEEDVVQSCGLPQLHAAMISQQLPSTLGVPSRATFAAEVTTPQLSNLITAAVAIAPSANSYHEESPPASQDDYLKVDQSPQDLKTLSPLSFPVEDTTAKDDNQIKASTVSFEGEREVDGTEMPEKLDVTQKLEINLQIDDSQFVMENGTKKWTCLQCPKTYSSKHNLITHVLGHSGIKPHCCLLCGKFFKQQSHLHTHMLTHGNVKPHSCKICQRSFTQASHMKRHMAVHMQKRPHICSVCERGFVYPCELKIHMAKHKTGKANVCADCDESFSTLKKLRIHMQMSHKDVSSLTCPECGKSFTYPSQLKDHMLKHEGKRPYICTECGMDFVKEHHLKAHAFTHTGLRPFVCLVCDRAFNQKANLLRHMVVHDEKRKFECGVCHRGFTQAQVLRAHMVTHADKKPHTCKKCGKGFSRLHNLNGHMHMHGGEKPHACFCGASFTLKGNLNRHKKEKHNINAGSEISTEEEAAFILNEMSAGHRSRVNSEDQERLSEPASVKKVKTSEDSQVTTTDLSSIDLITRFVSLNSDAGSGAQLNGDAGSGAQASLATLVDDGKKPARRNRAKRTNESPLSSVIPPPITTSQVNHETAVRGAARTKAHFVLPPKRRVSEIEKEAGLL